MQPVRPDMPSKNRPSKVDQRAVRYTDVVRGLAALAETNEQCKTLFKMKEGNVLCIGIWIYT